MSDENEVIDGEEYEEWQYEMSTDMALEYIEEELIPQIDNFETENSTEGFVPGVTSYVLFTKVAQDLLDRGFTVEELTDVIVEWSDVSPHRLVH